MKPTPLPDSLERTDWFDPAVCPTIPGMYECTLGAGSGHIFQRRWDGERWYSPITNLPSRIELAWRGIVPGSIDLARYGSAARNFPNL